MTFNLWHRHFICALGVAAVLVVTFNPPYSYAGTSRSMVNISGSITTPTCKINAGGQINVNFGVADITKIKTGLYKKSIPLAITCGPQPASIRLLFGTQASTDKFVDTSVKGLTIKITHGGSIWQPFTYRYSSTSSNNDIEATLMLSSSAEKQFLTSGINTKDQRFTAAITMSVDYD